MIEQDIKIAFTLLHYNNIDVTCESLEHLEKLKGIEKAEIVIVDNASPNNSGEVLERRYKCRKNVHIIINKENIGFSKGNNIGYQFAKNNLKCNLIVVMNNDILINDTNFIYKLRNASADLNSEIIAPNIIGRNGEQNPFRIKRLSMLCIYKIYIYNLLINFIYNIPFISIFFASALDKKENKRKRNVNIINRIENCIPHGACIIYTQKWTMKEDFAFLPITFMYFEEDILGEYIWRKDYRVSYNPELIVYHIEDASIEYDNQTSAEKRRFISKCMKESIKKLIDMRINTKIKGEYKK